MRVAHAGMKIIKNKGKIMRNLALVAIILSGAMTASSAKALTVDARPYISNKLSYSMMNKTNTSETWRYPGVEYYAEYFSDENSKAFGNRLAFGMEFSGMSMPGTVRAELEWGWNSRHEQKDLFAKDIYYDGIDTDVETLEEWLGYGFDKYGEKYNFKVDTYMLNLYYDLNTGTSLTPYAGVGAGMARIDAVIDAWDDSPSFILDVEEHGLRHFSSGKTNNIAWNAGLGLAYAVTDGFSVDLGYRFTWLGKDVLHKWTQMYDGEENIIDDQIVYKHTLCMHEVMLGVRYAF